MLVERSFDLGGVHVLAAANDDVLEPVDDVEVAIVVEAAEVAGVEPAVGERLGGLPFTAEVAANDRRAFEPDLADLADRLRRVPSSATTSHVDHRRDRLADALGIRDVRGAEVCDGGARMSP